MFKGILIGNLGADAEIKDANGSKFVTMRIANTDKWKTESGEVKEKTTWVDVTYNNVDSAVVPFLKAGTKVYVRGSLSLRVYSSQKDRCMKAGAQIAASEIELCGGQSELVPRQLIVPESGALVDVTKYYQANVDTSKWKNEDEGYLIDQKGNQYTLVKGGWVAPVQAQDQQAQEEQKEESK